MALIEIKDMSKIYGAGEATTVALDNVSLEIKKGEFISIMGPSGSGKSTLMHMMGLLDRPTHGTYHIDKIAAAELNQRERAKVRREKLGFIFQTYNLLPRLNAIENVALPLVYQRLSFIQRMKKASKMLKNVDLEDRQYYMPNQLSGGQSQRVAVARALVNDPALVLADEPTGNLDTKSSENIMKILAEIHKGGNTIVMVTHNPDLAEYGTRTIMLRDGKIESDKQHTPKKSEAKKPGKTDEKKAGKKDKKSKKKDKKK